LPSEAVASGSGQPATSADVSLRYQAFVAGASIAAAIRWSTPGGRCIA